MVPETCGLEMGFLVFFFLSSFFPFLSSFMAYVGLFLSTLLYPVVFGGSFRVYSMHLYFCTVDFR